MIPTASCSFLGVKSCTWNLNGRIVNYQVYKKDPKCLTHIFFGVELIDNKVNKVFNTGLMINEALLIWQESKSKKSSKFEIPIDFIKKYITKDMDKTQIIDFLKQQGFQRTLVLKVKEKVYYYYDVLSSKYSSLVSIDTIIANYPIFNRKNTKDCPGNSVSIQIKLKNNKEAVEIKGFYEIVRTVPMLWYTDCEVLTEYYNQFKL